MCDPKKPPPVRPNVAHEHTQFPVTEIGNEGLVVAAPIVIPVMVRYLSCVSRAVSVLSCYARQAPGIWKHEETQSWTRAWGVGAKQVRARCAITWKGGTGARTLSPISWRGSTREPEALVTNDVCQSQLPVLTPQEFLIRVSADAVLFHLCSSSLQQHCVGNHALAAKMC
jgi:hypothetical protein